MKAKGLVMTLVLVVLSCMAASSPGCDCSAHASQSHVSTK